MKDTHVTKVIFRKWKGENSGDIIALFPEVDEGSGFCGSYMHVGQHSGANYAGCIAATVPTKKEEYEDLEKELTSIGYNLKIRKRAQSRA